MIVVEVVRTWGAPGVHIELPAIPRLGDVVIVNDDFDGVVEEVIWEPGKMVKVRLG